MPKVVFEFKTEAERKEWLAGWYDGGGENGIYEYFEQNGFDYPDIKITEEK